ncbi:unnamed protein product [Ambrosiozyma monospora]|uniref:Unnamed protein product n=1 Tax=Ambrosiozyma monospora TaxID=43982 RepID=A0A9W7DES6_AMBMO|nr:unnamed protein product [Ambrosiozyma monospora]
MVQLRERKLTTPEIATVFTQFNKHVFQEQTNLQDGNKQSVKPTPELNLDEQNLAKPITLGEIKQPFQQQMTAIPNSALGCDGIPYKFFLATFETMTPRFLEVLNRLHVANDVSEMMTPVLLKFILKDGKDRLELSSYRPIALTSSTAHLFSKAIMHRIQSVFARIISPDCFWRLFVTTDNNTALKCTGNFNPMRPHCWNHFLHDISVRPIDE